MQYKSSSVGAGHSLNTVLVQCFLQTFSTSAAVKFSKQGIKR